MNPQHAPARRLDNGRVLIVEDSQEDAEAIQRALSRTHPQLRLEFLSRGDGLVEHLLGGDEAPGIVLLDLNMPGVSGHSALNAVRSRPELAEITVAVFTSSTAPAEVDACYAAGAPVPADGGTARPAGRTPRPVGGARRLRALVRGTRRPRPAHGGLFGAGAVNRPGPGGQDWGRRPWFAWWLRRVFFFRRRFEDIRTSR